MTKDTEHPLTELISIATKAGIGLLPGGGLLNAGYEGLQLLSKQAALQMERRAEKRYLEFIKNVFESEVSFVVTEHLTADDYTALLSGCMADMENEKAKYYGRMAAAIGRGEITSDHRRSLIIMLSQLSELQLQMLRKSFIASQFSLRPDQGSGELDEIHVLHIREPIQKHEYNELVNRSLYVSEKLSDLAKILVRACFNTQELQPAAIGQLAWHPKIVDIIFDSNQTGLVLSLTVACWGAAFRSTNRAIHIIDRPTIACFASPHVMIIGSETAPDYLPALKARTRGDDVLFVCYHDHKKLIREFYPESTTIDAKGVSTANITEQVMSRIKAE